MIDEILEKYKTFSDTVINKIVYNEHFKNKVYIKNCKIYLFSYNWLEDNYEDTILVFENIKEFRFIKRENMSSTVITDALLKSENGEIILDFFPKQYSDSILEIDYTDSDFLIRSESILLQKLDSEDL